MVCAFPAMELTAHYRISHLPPTIHQVRNYRLSGGQGPLCKLKTTQKKGILKVSHGIKTDKVVANKDEGFSQLLCPLDIVEDIHSGVLSREWIMRSLSSASVQSKSPPKQKEGGKSDDKEDFNLNTGYAIRALREQLPAIFYKEPIFDIYREDIVFKDPLNNFTGIENYKLIFWALRFHGRIFFKAIWVDILRIWHPAENVIMVRWTVHGIPRVPWETQGRFDGTSEYKLDKKGKIYEHKVDNVVPTSPSKFNVPVVENLIRALGCPSTPKPTYFESVGFWFWMSLPYLIQFSWVHYYLAMKRTVDLKNARLRFSCLQA